jgi:thiamine-phosphate pyrophosphorylase
MITDGTAAEDREAWIDHVVAGLNSGANMIQIREKNLDAGELLELTRLTMAFAGEALVVVNSRVDVAIAAGATGAHLPALSIPPSRWRAIAPGFLLGVSCHTLTELRAAEDDGADYAIFGPVFAPLSKTSDLTPRGVDGLRAAARSVRIPVFGVGGITMANAQDCFDAGAQGIAAISLFRGTA